MYHQDIVVGKAYVNEDASILREVIEEIDEGYVRFNTFDLATGRLTPTRHRLCAKVEMASWAQRPATPSEVDLVHPYEGAAWLDCPVPREAQAVYLEAARAALESSPGLHFFPALK